jgi:hypothetical protein
MEPPQSVATVRMLVDEVRRLRLMWFWTEQVSMMDGHRENNSGEDDEHQGQNHENKASSKPPSNESETNGNTEIGTDHCKH